MENGNEFLDKDSFLAMEPAPMEAVSIPECKGMKIFVCGLSATAKNAYQASLVEIQGNTRKIKLEHSTAKLLVQTLVTKDRQRIFTDTDVLKVGTLRADVLERLAKIANRLSGMDEEENKQLLKNSEAAQSGDSPTVSL